MVGPKCLPLWLSAVPCADGGLLRALARAQRVRALRVRGRVGSRAVRAAGWLGGRDGRPAFEWAGRARRCCRTPRAVPWAEAVRMRRWRARGEGAWWGASVASEASLHCEPAARAKRASAASQWREQSEPALRASVASVVSFHCL